MLTNQKQAFLWGHEPGRARQAAELLARHHFDDSTICELLGINSGHSLSERDLPTLLSLTEADTPLNALVRLFLIGVTKPVVSLHSMMTPPQLESWIEAGLLTREGDAVRGAIKLVPFQGLLVAFDLPPWASGGHREDYVMGIGSSTLTLANLTIRRPLRVTLDLGTGCGVLAMLAARHSERVIAVDCNPRSVQFAAFNARLNGLEHVECRESDLFSAVSEERFDLVVCNPPFVVSPETTYVYRDGGLEGDGFVRRIVRQVPEVLAENGYCQMLCNWAHIAGEAWEDRLAHWAEGTGCDIWAMQTDTLDAAGYAAKWIRHTERDEPGAYESRLQAWTAYYQQQGIEAVSGGLITLRRRTAGPNWFRADSGPEKMRGPAGDDVMAAFSRRDFLDSCSDEELLERFLRLPDHLRLAQHSRPSPEGWELVDSVLYLDRGMAYSGRVDAPVVRFIKQCDGRHRVREVLQEIGRELGADSPEVQLALLGVVRQLIERGFILPD